MNWRLSGANRKCPEKWQSIRLLTLIGSAGYFALLPEGGWLVSVDLPGVAVDKQAEVELWAVDFKESPKALTEIKFE